MTNKTFTIMTNAFQEVNFSNNKNMRVNPLSANFTKWSNTLKQFVLSVFDHFVGLAVKGLKSIIVL